MAKKDKYVWAIGYINKDLCLKIQWDLEKYPEFKNVEVCIPTVRVLNKKFKSRMVYDNIPLMLNYGFFKVTKKQILDMGFMNRLKEASVGLTGWLKNLANADKQSLKRLKKNIDESLPIAFTDSSFIERIKKLAELNDVYSPSELSKLAKHQTITLKVYPFDGMQAKVLEIDEDKRKVRVQLIDNVGTGFLDKHWLDFEHVFFTIYKSETDPTLSGLIYLEDIRIVNQNSKAFKDETS